MSDALNSAAVAAVDKSGLLADVLAIPDHIGDALWRVESAFLEPVETRSLVVCGMGGSAIGADLAAAVIGQRAERQLLTVRGYELPSWVDERDTVVLSSYSGSTEETLACFEQAAERGARRYVVSSGGPLSEAAHEAGIPVIGLPGIFQPRAAFAYGVVAVIGIAIACGAVSSALREELAAAADQLRADAERWGPDGDDPLPKELARAAFGRLPVIHGADLTAPVAYRWKCQINENAEHPAVSTSLPEGNHNEICGWAGSRELTEAAAWFLSDTDQSPRIAARLTATAEIVAAHGAEVRSIAAFGGTRAERVFSLVLLGDLMSLYLATLRGVDPTPVTLIDELKTHLERSA